MLSVLANLKKNVILCTLKRFSMKKILIIFVVGLMTSCMHSNKFIVTGTIEGGAGEMIYLETQWIDKNHSDRFYTYQEEQHFPF